jgi:transglutaminase-like putative cysteine protease
MTDRQRLPLWVMRLSLILIAVCIPVRAFPEAAPQQPSATGVITADEEDRIVSSLPAVPPGLNTAYSLKVWPSETVSASFTIWAKYPEYTINEWELICALPPNLPDQTISNLQTKPAMDVIEDLAPLHRKLLRAHVHSAATSSTHELKVSISFDARLQPRMLLSRGPSAAQGEPAALTEAERKLALRPSVQLDYTSAAFRAWLDKNQLHRAEQEGEVDFARRVYQAIGKNIRYDLYVGRTSERASFVCTVSEGTCAGLSNVFAAALRSQGIPARVLMGRIGRADSPSDSFNGVRMSLGHAVAEFFAQGVGWVPVDATGASSGMYWFGKKSPIFITMHVDPDLTIATAAFGQQKRKELASGSWWFRGSGNTDGQVHKIDWTFKYDGQAAASPDSGKMLEKLAAYRAAAYQYPQRSGALVRFLLENDFPDGKVPAEIQSCLEGDAATRDLAVSSIAKTFDDMPAKYKMLEQLYAGPLSIIPVAAQKYNLARAAMYSRHLEDAVSYLQQLEKLRALEGNEVLMGYLMGRLLNKEDIVQSFVAKVPLHLRHPELGACMQYLAGQLPAAQLLEKSPTPYAAAFAHVLLGVEAEVKGDLAAALVSYEAAAAAQTLLWTPKALGKHWAAAVNEKTKADAQR